MSTKHPKFLCDAMLGHVGRRLRSAGYDTLIDDGQRPDDKVVELAVTSGRILLSCDVGIQRDPRGANLIFLSDSDEQAWAAKLFEEVSVNWLLAPFTRCLDCNTELIRTTEKQNEQMPENIRKYGPPGLHCQTCNKLFWEGSHTDRMRARLTTLQSYAEANRSRKAQPQ